MFNEITTENIPELLKNMNLQILEAKKNNSRDTVIYKK